MPCYAPLRAFYSREVNPGTGLRGITFNRNSSLSGSSFKVPCGQCIGCRLERSRQWAIRCMHEKKLHADNEFVTLTYDNDHIPADWSLNKRHMQLFMKRLRKIYGAGVRFYGCGEYGDENGRPHYHLILFNWTVEDKRLYKYNHRGEAIYSSIILDKIWGQGFTTLGDVTFDSAAYVARYVMKKVTGDAAPDHYERVAPNGEIYCLQPEFTNMSRRPGIGADFFHKFSKEIYDHDSVIMNGVEVRPPRYYDVRMAAIDAPIVAALKVKRRRNAIKHRKDNMVDRLRVRETVQLLRARRLERKV